jgi:hypothetical protein
MHAAGYSSYSRAHLLKTSLFNASNHYQKLTCTSCIPHAYTLCDASQVGGSLPSPVISCIKAISAGRRAAFAVPGADLKGMRGLARGHERRPDTDLSE